ncbi:MAG: hypothetical protein SOX32_07020 [Candidatus Choladocola sp.]|nr:hypothetical protein [Candidatus Choladocola sp.]
MSKKQAVRALLFFIVLFGVVIAADSVLRMEKVGDILAENRRFRELYTDPEDTWDGIILGTSVVDRSWAAPEAWSKYGMAVYPLSTDGQPFFLTVSLIEEAMKYQEISFVVVDLHGFRPENLKVSSKEIREVTDQMKWSVNRVKTVKRALDYMEEWYPGFIASSDITKASYYLPILRYHRRLTGYKLYKEDFFPGKTEMKGVYEGELRLKVKPVDLKASDAFTELTGQQIQLLDELIAFAEEKEIQLVFLNSPSVMEEKQQGSINAAAAYVAEKGCLVLNFNDSETLEQSGLDGKTDFTDELHLNTVGARKFTDMLAAYLHDNLEIQDHRGDSRYQSWDEAAEKYKEFYMESAENLIY